MEEVETVAVVVVVVGVEAAAEIDCILFRLT